jgi:hypothetical protein
VEKHTKLHFNLGQSIFAAKALSILSLGIKGPLYTQAIGNEICEQIGMNSILEVHIVTIIFPFS